MVTFYNFFYNVNYSDIHKSLYIWFWITSLKHLGAEDFRISP